jgi:hypothetical protein
MLGAQENFLPARSAVGLRIAFTGCLIALLRSEVPRRSRTIPRCSRLVPRVAHEVALARHLLAIARYLLTRSCSARMRSRVGPRRQSDVGGILIKLRALPIAVAERLIPIRRRLIAIAARLILVAQIRFGTGLPCRGFFV